LARSGFNPSEYDLSRTHNWIDTVARRVATGINIATKNELDEARASEDPFAAVGNVFDKASTSRTAEIATTQVTLMSGFGATESGKQLGGGRARKTWIVTSSNPRPEHEAMNGETVGIDENFSIGAPWPADASLSVDQIAGCTCEVEVTIA
jgi:hypothetical protein